MSYLDDPEVFKAGLVIIGNEILSGRTHDTNTVWIAENLTAHGVVLTEVRIVPDIEDKIVEAVNALRPQVHYVFTTGGIGPTHDDITAASIAKALDVEIEENQSAVHILRDYYGADELTPARRSMALMPVGAQLIPNAVSGAPGFFVENVYVMAGIPRIMQSMLKYLIDYQLRAGKKVFSNIVACSIHESVIAAPLSEVQTEFDDVEIGSYPHFRGGVLGLNLVLRATDEARLKAASEAVLKIVKDLGDEPGAVGMQTPIDTK